jgi:hypothetical protein
MFIREDPGWLSGRLTTRDGFEDVLDTERSEEALVIGIGAEAAATRVLLAVADLDIDGCGLEQAMGDAAGHSQCRCRPALSGRVERLPGPGRTDSPSGITVGPTMS